MRTQRKVSTYQGESSASEKILTKNAQQKGAYPQRSVNCDLRLEHKAQAHQESPQKYASERRSLRVSEVKGKSDGSEKRVWAVANLRIVHEGQLQRHP